MLHFVRFDNYLPWAGSKPGVYDKTAVYHVAAKARRALQHQAQINLGEGPILHPLLHVRRQLKLPIPPLGKRHAPSLPRLVVDSRCQLRRQWHLSTGDTGGVHSVQVQRHDLRHALRGQWRLLRRPLRQRQLWHRRRRQQMQRRRAMHERPLRGWLVLQ
jgi:hypothetical protein